MAARHDSREIPFLVWLARNPTGIPRSSGLTRALIGTLLAGLFSVALARRLRPQAPLAPLIARGLAAAIAGGALSPLAVTTLTYALDRRLPRRDDLLGYSGVMRELLHAGELSALGALGAGLGQSAGAGLRGAAAGIAGTSALGGLLYGLRGFGPGLGVGAGLLSGLLGALLGGALRWGERPAASAG